MLKVVVLHKIIMRLLLDLIFLLQMIVTTNDCGIKPIKVNSYCRGEQRLYSVGNSLDSERIKTTCASYCTGRLCCRFYYFRYTINYAKRFPSACFLVFHHYYMLI